MENFSGVLEHKIKMRILELKNKITEVKLQILGISLNRVALFISRLDTAKERISWMNDRSKENIQTEALQQGGEPREEPNG